MTRAVTKMTRMVRDLSERLTSAQNDVKAKAKLVEQAEAEIQALQQQVETEKRKRREATEALKREADRSDRLSQLKDQAPREPDQALLEEIRASCERELQWE